MAREIHEKQLILQKKLWKVEDTLRQKIQKDKVGVAVKDNHKTVEINYYDGKADNKPRQRSEMLMHESEQNTEQHRSRQDTKTKKHKEQETKWDKKLAEKAVPKRKVNKPTYVRNKETPPKSQHEAACRMTTAHLHSSLKA